MNEARFRALIAELDKGVPRATDAVRIVQRDDGLGVVATRQGALRLGIAILRAALEEAERGSDASDAADELAELIDDHGTWIEDVRTVDALPTPDADDGGTPRERTINAGCGVMAIAAIFFAFFGFVKFAEATAAMLRALF